MALGTPGQVLEQPITKLTLAILVGHVKIYFFQMPPSIPRKNEISVFRAYIGSKMIFFHVTPYVASLSKVHSLDPFFVVTFLFSWFFCCCCC